MSNYCVTSNLGTVRRENGIGTLQLSNTFGVNISDEGLQNVYIAYITEVMKERKNDEQN